MVIFYCEVVCFGSFLVETRGGEFFNFECSLLRRELIVNITAGIKETFVTTVGGIARVKESFNVLPKNSKRAIRGYAKVNMRSKRLYKWQGVEHTCQGKHKINRNSCKSTVKLYTSCN